MENTDDNSLEQAQLRSLDLQTIALLAKWSKFLAILMLAIIAFMLLSIIATFGYLSSYIVAFIGVYISTQTAIAGIFFLIPTYFLFQFTKQLNTIRDINNSFQLKAAFKYLRLFFKSLVLLSLFFILLKISFLFVIFIGL